MRKIGLVGGLGPASTVDYYLGLVELYRKNFGEDVYPELVIDSVNMHDVIAALKENREQDMCEIILKSVSALKAAGAQIAAITSNTPHILWDSMKDQFEIPVLSIVEAAIEEMQRCDYRRVLIFGTTLTMSSGLYDESLRSRGIFPIIPEEKDRIVIGDLIYPNLENGIVILEDKEKMIRIAEKYIEKYQADAMLLGCTEIPLMIKPGDVSVPVLNTTLIHIKRIMKELKE